MSVTTVAEYLEGALEAEPLRRAQVKSAGTIIAQFLLVREGLTGRVPDDKVDSVAATLTAGIWANNQD